MKFGVYVKRNLAYAIWSNPRSRSWSQDA